MVYGLWLVGCGTTFHTIGAVDTASSLLDTAVDTDPPDTDTAPLVLPLSSCEADNDAPAPGSPVTLSGANSVDPLGGALSYRWSLTAPTDSTATLSATDVVSPTFTPDLIGSYFADLVVTADGERESERCSVEMTARAPAGLDVTITWTLVGDDLDLHVVAPGGTLRDPVLDCQFDNKNPDWGPAGPEGDPFLDVEDEQGTGPEHMFIMSPGAGTYTLVVHDYPTIETGGANDVTMTVREDGVVVWSATRTVTDESSDTTFATVTFPGGAVTPAP